ncbi:unnamed protein product [Sphagnum jensenii]|uniref:Transcription factor IIIC 90kDa subunit N-terminal domain-containing protein n=1 Tax=Sphagnum jensenii TaxID=128206 RepID=A0ABP0XDI8_9BRYO
MGHVEPLEFTGYGDEDGHTFPSPSSTLALVGAPTFPNSIKWSEDNLIAVASGHLVTILNPASLSGPRGYASILQSQIFDIGTVKREDLSDSVLLPFRLWREGRVGVRALDWSPQGLASNGSCLLGVCTTDFRIKLYRAPFCDYKAEWVEVADLSELIYAYCLEKEFKETEVCKNKLTYNFRQTWIQKENWCLVEKNVQSFCIEFFLQMSKFLRQKQAKAGNLLDMGGGGGAFKNSSEEHSERVVTPSTYAARHSLMSPLVLAWSPKWHANDQGFVFCAVGTRAGSVSVFRFAVPISYSIEKALPLSDFCFLGFLRAHKSWVTSVSWASCPGPHAGTPNSDGGFENTMLLATGCADGSVKLWSGDSQILASLPSCSGVLPFTLLRQVVEADLVLVSSLTLSVPTRGSTKALMAVGKGSGCISAWEFDVSWCCTRIACQLKAHDQVVTGLTWGGDGRCLYSCGQDNHLKSWEFMGSELSGLPFPDCSALFVSETPQVSSDLPASALDRFYGVTLSPGCLAMAVVRGIASEMLDPMYQSRTQKGVVQLFWVGGQRFKGLLANMGDSMVEIPIAKSLWPEDLANWGLQIASTLHHMEDYTEALVLWDVIAALSFLKSLAGIQVMVSIISGWLQSCWKEHNHFMIDPLCMSVGSLQLCLANASCRQLQMACVIYRRMLLGHSKFEELSGESSRENWDTGTDETIHMGLPGIPREGGGLAPTSEQEQLWKKHLWHMEHELRQRLILLTLSAAASLEGAEHEQDVLKDKSTELWLMADWVLANGSVIFPELLEVAAHIRYSSDDIRFPSGELRPLESCTFCDAVVPLTSPEVAYCHSVELNSDDINHKLLRCAVSLQVCPAVPSWYCSCCARWATKLAPALFFTLLSRKNIKQVSSSLVLQQPALPTCPFCGVSLHRFLPDFLLSPTAV